MLTFPLASMNGPSHVIHTLYTFTRSDVLTILVPTTVFGTVASGVHQTRDIALRVLWVWLHLLQFCVSNQTTNPQEDRVNKPWRPIPSGRISVKAARFLRWTLVPICLSVSAWCRILPVGVTLSLATFAHNELGLDTHWHSRNLLNAIGYACFSIGATMAGLQGSTTALPWTSIIAQALLSLVILTTIQAQDFKDVHGDSLIGRQTLPLVYPRGSRVLMAILLPAWSLLFATRYAEAGTLMSSCTVLLGVATSARFFFERSQAQDKKTYLYYNVWLLSLHVIPFLRTPGIDKD